MDSLWVKFGCKKVVQSFPEMVQEVVDLLMKLRKVYPLVRLMPFPRGSLFDKKITRKPFNELDFSIDFLDELLQVRFSAVRKHAQGTFLYMLSKRSTYVLQALVSFFLARRDFAISYLSFPAT